jgi:signal transduction histidine kinase
MKARYTVEQIQALVEAGIALTSELSLEVILQKLVDIAREQANARYAALSVLGADGTISRFATSGISNQQRERIGRIPEGHGLLGVLLHEGESLLLTDLSRDPRFRGFPPNHPPMKSLLGVPVFSKGRVIGNLYLTEKLDGEGFVDSDEEIVRMLATQAAAAIETSRLQEQLESLARLEERERIAMDLHDGVIQSVYATALHLEDASEQLAKAPEESMALIDKSIDSLHQVIKDIRAYIFDLRVQVSEVEDLASGIRKLADTVRINTLMDVQVEIREPGRLDAGQALGLFHIAQEALNNVSKHSHATMVSIRLSKNNGRVALQIEDNGTGFDPDEKKSGEGQGLRNIRDRARALGAETTIDSRAGQGTMIRVELPQTSQQDAS